VKTWQKVAAVTLVVGVIAFFFESNMPLGWVLWPPAPENPAPTPAQIPLFVLLGIAEAVVFGLGVSFLLFGYPLVKLVPMSTPWNVLTFLAIAWTMVNWFPHDSLHNHIGPNLGSLLAVEYGFHVTLMVAGLIVARFFILVARQAMTVSPQRRPATVP
jgi:hypothetical protein